MKEFTFENIKDALEGLSIFAQESSKFIGEHGFKLLAERVLWNLSFFHKEVKYIEVDYSGLLLQEFLELEINEEKKLRILNDFFLEATVVLRVIVGDRIADKVLKKVKKGITGGKYGDKKD